MTNPEVFEVTNFINDINQEFTQVLMTTDKEGNYRAAYTYGLERIGVEDLVKVEGKPNNPLYYLQDAIGSTIAITNMNASIIDNNRFGPYGEPISPVAKNARLTNSYYGYTGEMHDIEGEMLYLRARYFDFNTSQFMQQDSYLGKISEPLTRNLYMYAQGNPLKYTDPSGHMSYFTQVDDLLEGVWDGIKSDISGIKDMPKLVLTMAKLLIKGDLKIDDLISSTLQGMVEDYIYYR